MVGNRLTTNYWYNRRGLHVKTASANGLFTKSLYDGAGRETVSVLSIDADETAWSESLSAGGDYVIEQSQTFYDGTRPVVGVTYQREKDDDASIGLLNGANSYRSGSASWYDAASRPTVSATFGRDDESLYIWDASGAIRDANGDGVPDIAAGGVHQPNQSADWIASRTEYDAAGRAFRVTDNLGRRSVTEFDLLDRATRSVANWVDGVATESEVDSDNIVRFVYDPQGRLVQQVAVNAAGPGNGIVDQTTRYLYESTINGAWRTGVIHADSDDVDSSGTDQIKTAYDRLGRVVTQTDQRGVDRSGFRADADPQWGE